MADEEQLALLKQGVEVWNQWRSKNPKQQIDLSEANLSRANLSRAILSGANLKQTNLSGANLSRAILSGADLRRARLLRTNLSAVDLSAAFLEESFFSGADLSGANLSETTLLGSIFHGVDLREASLAEALCKETFFNDVDLSSTKGLGSCKHWGPSSIDFRTLAKSGLLPLAFLRGVGLPDTLIDYLPSLLNQPIQFYSCFISYSSKDQEFSDRLYADLQNKGVRCWFAPEDLPIGAKIRVGIDEAIRIHDKLLLVLSETSVNSQWVEQEVETALEKERDLQRTVLFPIRIDDAVMDSRDGWTRLIKNSRNIGDFTKWKDHDLYQKALQRLLRDLTAGEK
jgi:uncharacterized protein YjbI with pentapeptide repeats